MASSAVEFNRTQHSVWRVLQSNAVTIVGSGTGTQVWPPNHRTTFASRALLTETIATLSRDTQDITVHDSACQTLEHRQLAADSHRGTIELRSYLADPSTGHAFLSVCRYPVPVLWVDAYVRLLHLADKNMSGHVTICSIATDISR